MITDESRETQSKHHRRSDFDMSDKPSRVKARDLRGDDRRPAARRTA